MDVDVGVAVGVAVGCGVWVDVADGINVGGAMFDSVGDGTAPGCAAYRAASMFSSPLPYAFGDASVIAFVVALERIASRTWVRVRFGNMDHITAAAPATWGEAIDVPDIVTYPPNLYVL